MDDAGLTRWMVAQLGTIPGWEWSAEGPYDITADHTHVFEGALPADARPRGRCPRLWRIRRRTDRHQDPPGAAAIPRRRG